MTPRAAALGLLLAFGATGASAQKDGADVVLGIRLGFALEAQMKPCAGGELIMTAGPEACWRSDSIDGRVAALPARLLREIDAPLTIRRLREVDGVIVEIEAEIRPEYVGKVLAHLIRRHGKPGEVETYERASRVTGRSSHRTHSWKSAGATMVLVELAGSDMGELRTFLDSWAATAK